MLTANYRKLIITGITAVAALISYAAEDNLLINPSFENGEDGKPTGWVMWGGKPEEVKWSSGQAKSGSKSLAVLSVAGKDGCRWITEEAVKVVPGGEYELNGWLKTRNAGGNCSLSIAWYSANGWLSTSRSLLINRTHDWRFIAFKAKAPQKAVCAKIYVGKILPGAGECWFDDVSFSKVGGGSAPAVPVASDTLKLKWEKTVEKEIKLKTGEKVFSNPEVKLWMKLNPQDALSVSLNKGIYSVKDTFGNNTGWISGPVAVTPGKTYGFSAGIYRDKSYNVFLGIAWLGDNYRANAVNIGKVEGESTSWQNFAISAKAPVEAVKARFFVIQRRSSGRTDIKLK